jgi:hypothetical protein
VDADRADKAVMWLRALAEDVLDHESCRGCQLNAAQALDDLGLLAEVLAKLDMDDPRKAWAASAGDGSAAYRSERSIQMDEE